MSFLLFLGSFGLTFSQKLGTKQRGVASYYADMFHGRRTANGERYSKNDYTAAHRTFPFNTVVKVTNLDNGKTILLRVNDRGPYAHQRLIDVSGIAGRELGLTGPGFANVEIEVVEESVDIAEDLIVFDLEVKQQKYFSGIHYDPWGNQRQLKGYSVKVDEYSNFDMAQSGANDLFNEGYRSVYIYVTEIREGEKSYWLLSGDFINKKLALKHEEFMRLNGRFGSIIKFKL